VKRRILDGNWKFSGPNFAIWTTKMDRSRTDFAFLIYHTKINCLFFSTRNHFAFMFGRKFQWNFDKSDVRDVNKGLSFTRVFTGRGSRRGRINYQQIKKNHCNKYLIELACSVHIREYWSRSFFASLWAPLVALLTDKPKTVPIFFQLYGPHASSITYILHLIKRNSSLFTALVLPSSTFIADEVSTLK